jgi:positive regulator of sigma E activity
MIETSARVIYADNGTARVEPTAQSGCGGCKTSSSCVVSGLGKYFSSRREAITVKCDASVCVGDELRMTMSEADFLKAGLMAYLLPSLFTILGASIAASLDYGDVGAVAGAVLGFASSLLLVRLLAWVPRMTVSRVKGLFNEGEAP